MISVPKVGLLSLKMTKLHLFEFVTDVWYEFVILFVLHFTVFYLIFQNHFIRNSWFHKSNDVKEITVSIC